MTEAAEICRAAKPEADDGWCQHILWGRTPFPVGRVTAQSLYRAASGLARAERKGHVLCDFCEVVVPPGHYTCLACDAALHFRDDDEPDLTTMQADVTTVPLLATVPGELRER